MLGKFIKFSFVPLVAFLLGGLTMLSIVHSARQNSILSSVQEIQSRDNISDNLERRAKDAVSLSRHSAVNVMSMSIMGVVSSSTGTYIKNKDSFYILTVAHGVVGPCELMRIVIAGDMVKCLEYVHINIEQDYAIIKIDENPHVKPVHIPSTTPRNNHWDESLSIQSTVFYTGFPNGMGPMTFRGNIVGYDERENVYLHSFAWPGSSGSGVFNEDGKLIGYVMAISVGNTDYGIDVLEDIVIIAPLYKIDWSVLE